MSDKISVKDAQAEINGLLVAEICRDFGINFLDVYPERIRARGVGPEQAFIGLAIKRGHLALPAVQPDAAAIRKAALKSALVAVDHVELFGQTTQDMHAALEQYVRCRDAILALIDNPRKEAMLDGSDRVATDIGPGDQAVAGAAGPFRASPSDWTEDFAHENGSYMCRCFTCGEQFFGYKRRVTCRVCAQPTGLPRDDRQPWGCCVASVLVLDSNRSGEGAGMTRIGIWTNDPKS